MQTVLAANSNTGQSSFEKPRSRLWAVEAEEKQVVVIGERDGVKPVAHHRRLRHWYPRGRGGEVGVGFESELRCKSAPHQLHSITLRCAYERRLHQNLGPVGVVGAVQGGLQRAYSRESAPRGKIGRKGPARE